MELLRQYGYSLIFAVVFLEQLGFPIPALPVLMIAGALAASHSLHFGTILLVAVIASLSGDFLWYEIGRRRGRSILKLMCRISLSPESCVRKTEDSFLKHGINSLLYAKFVPGLNTIAPPMSGTVRAGFFAFLWRDLIGALLYITACVLPGFLFEKKVFDLTTWVEQVGRTFFLVAVAALVAYLLYKYFRLKLIQRRLVQVRITPSELQEMIERGDNLVVVDLRGAHTAGAQVIPGALRVHPDHIDQHLGEVEKERWIVMYCT